MNLWANALSYRANRVRGRRPDARQEVAHSTIQAINRDPRLVVHASDHVIRGIERALTHEGMKPDRARDLAAEVERRITGLGGTCLEDPPEVSRLSIEWEDRRVHDTAIATGSTFVVTGDVRFADCCDESLASPGGVLIYLPDELIRALQRHRTVGGGAPSREEAAPNAVARVPHRTMRQQAPSEMAKEQPWQNRARHRHAVRFPGASSARPHRRPPPRGRER